MNNIVNNIKSLISCRRGEHCLFRSFGLNMVDEPNRLTRNSLQLELNRWFPSEVVEAVTVKKASESGEFEYNIKIRGVNNG